MYDHCGGHRPSLGLPCRLPVRSFIARLPNQPTGGRAQVVSHQKAGVEVGFRRVREFGENLSHLYPAMLWTTTRVGSHDTHGGSPLIARTAAGVEDCRTQRGFGRSHSGSPAHRTGADIPSLQLLWVRDCLDFEGQPDYLKGFQRGYDHLRSYRLSSLPVRFSPLPTSEVDRRRQVVWTLPVVLAFRCRVSSG